MNESREAGKNPLADKAGLQSSELPSSAGDSPKEMTPKDISPQDAAWADLCERKTASDNPQEREEALLDEAVEDTFPASDPIAEMPATHHSEHDMTGHDEEEESLDHAIEMTFPASDPIAIASSEELSHERDLRQTRVARPTAPSR